MAKVRYEGDDAGDYKFKPGWLYREIEAAQKEMAAWPEWKRRGLGDGDG